GNRDLLLARDADLIIAREGPVGGILEREARLPALADEELAGQELARDVHAGGRARAGHGRAARSIGRFELRESQSHAMPHSPRRTGPRASSGPAVAAKSFRTIAFPALF